MADAADDDYRVNQSARRRRRRRPDRDDEDNIDDADEDDCDDDNDDADGDDADDDTDDDADDEADDATTTTMPTTSMTTTTTSVPRRRRCVERHNAARRSDCRNEHIGFYISSVRRPSSGHQYLYKMYTVEEALVVSGHDRWTSPIILRHCVKIDGVTFAKMCKSDSSVRRLALAKCDDTQSMSLGRALVFDQIIEKRDAIVDDLTAKAVAAMNGDEFEALDIDATPTRKRKEPDVDIPEVATIMGPSHNDVDGINIKVRLMKGKALWLEVTPDVVEYLMNMCQSQVMSDDIIPKRNRYSSPSGTTWCAGKGMLRVHQTNETTKQKTTRYKKIAKVDPDAMRAAAMELKSSCSSAVDLM